MMIHIGSNKIFNPNAIINLEKMLGKTPNKRCIAQAAMIRTQNIMILVNGPRITSAISSSVCNNVLW
jgi:hypothetical protein